MNFEINDSKEPIPDEEDIYGVNDIEDQDRLKSILGGVTQEQRIRRRRTIVRIVAAFIALWFLSGLIYALGRYLLGW